MSVLEVRARLSAGLPPGDLAGLPPRAARAVALSVDVGAPVLPALAAAQEAADDARDRARALRVASAQGRTVAAGLLLLPVVMVPGLGGLLGLDLVGFYGTPTGRLVALVAGALLALGLVTVRLLVRRAAAAPDGADEVADLLAAAVSAGIGIPAALRAAVPHLQCSGDVLARMALALEMDRSVDVPPPYDRMLATLRTTARWGAPAAPALRHLADDLRSERHHRALEAVERLPALLTFPTALFLLPASVLLVGAPLVADGLAAAAGAG